MPLLTHLSHAELRSVIAHEFGHYVSGDVALGPWIYKTRGAIARALAAASNRWIAAPFQWYAMLFMRTTQAISRDQEFAADRVAAGVAGRAATQSALQRVSELAAAYGTYLQVDLFPALQAGHLPPIADGFREFLTSPDTTALVAAAREQALSADADALDSHPSLRERLDALDRIIAPDVTLPEAETEALVDEEAQARAWLAFTMGAEPFAELRPIAWDAVAAEVHQPQWRTLLRDLGTPLGARSAEQMPIGREAFLALGASLVAADFPEAPDETRVSAAAQVLAMALADVMARAGWLPKSRPGFTLTMEREGVSVDVRQTISTLADGTETAESWQARCATLGITGMLLVPQGPRSDPWRRRVRPNL